MSEQKVLVVEGKADRLRVQRILAEPVKIICTYGTISEYDLDELMAPYEIHDIYVFVDADYTGEQIRELFHRNYSEAIHLYTNEFYKEVEATPYRLLAEQLMNHFKIHQQFLLVEDD